MKVVYYSVLYFILSFIVLIVVDTKAVISQEEIYLGPRESRLHPVWTTEKVRFSAHSADNKNFTAFIYQRPSSVIGVKNFLMDCHNVAACSVSNLVFGSGIDIPEIINIGDEPQTIVVTVSRLITWKDDSYSFVIAFVCVWILLLSLL